MPAITEQEGVKNEEQIRKKKKAETMLGQVQQGG